MPTTSKQEFALVGTTEDPEVAIGNTQPASGRGGRGKSGAISKVGIERTSATSGTQWRIRYFLGWTADPDRLCILSVDIPAAADVFDHGVQSSSKPAAGAVEFSTDYNSFADGWTTTTTPKAGLGLWHSLQQIGGSGDDTCDVYTTISRR